MPDKCLERFYLDQLFVALQLAPEQDPEDGESPDFLVRAGGRTVGVELTMFHLPPKPGAKPGRELAALQDRAVEYARRKFREAGGPALYVSVAFMDRGPHSKRRAYELGQHLADLVSAADLPASLADGARYLAEDRLPPEIGRGRILASVDGEDELWDPGGGGWVQKVTETHIRNVVAAKDRTLDRIRTRCDVAWLVIAHDLFREGSPSELSATEVDTNYPTGFDRLLWLEVAVPSVRELHRIEPAAA